MEIKIGDYVLATKYDDGDPCDHFCVRFVQSFLVYRTGEIRFNVVDSEGKPFRGNGFRKARKITPDGGITLLERFPKIGNVLGKSLWWHLKDIRNNLKTTIR